MVDALLHVVSLTAVCLGQKEDASNCLYNYNLPMVCDGVCDLPLLGNHTAGSLSANYMYVCRYV